MGYTPHIAVVGGGATGTAIARDLAMRGLDVTLVEKGTLTDGTTGRMHGLLHSGARYADTDPETAAACLAENRVLRDIAGHCVEETGGLFASLPSDDPNYFERKREACETVGIPIEERTGTEARASEPTLSDDVERVLRVPDAVVDPFRLTVATAKSALNHGADIQTHTEVTNVLLEDGAVDSLRLRHEDPGTDTIDPGNVTDLDVDYVVNATGPWAPKIANMARLDIELQYSKGAMVVANCREPDTVLNRCRPPDDGDSVVPYGRKAILGTTHEPVDDPESYEEERWEVDLVIEAGAELVPALATARTIRSYWGVRPLYDPEERGDTGETAGDFTLLDHEQREGTWGMTTVVGGTVTTSRRIAERVTDHVCAKFGINRECYTADEPLPGSDDPDALERALERFGVDSPVSGRSACRLGSRAEAVLDTDEPTPLVCQCEAVPRAEVRDALNDETGEEPDLNEVRIRTRASMGDCQGGYCVHRLANELYPYHEESAVRTALETLMDERWTGQRHALWGRQLSQAMANYALHATTMNRDARMAKKKPGIALSRFDAGPGDSSSVSSDGDSVADPEGEPGTETAEPEGKPGTETAEPEAGTEPDVGGELGTNDVADEDSDGGAFPTASSGSADRNPDPDDDLGLAELVGDDAVTGGETAGAVDEEPESIPDTGHESDGETPALDDGGNGSASTPPDGDRESDQPDDAGTGEDET